MDDHEAWKASIAARVRNGLAQYFAGANALVPKNAEEAKNFLLSASPGYGNYLSAKEVAPAYNRGDYDLALGSAIGAVPFLGGMMSGAAKRLHVTQTPEFQKWFGGSRIVDAEGQPLMMYRGSANPDALPYGNGNMVYLTPKRDFADRYAQGGGKTFEVYASAANPFDASRGEGYQLWKQFDKEHPYYGSKGTDRGLLPFWTAERDLRKFLDERGVPYDSIYFGENDRSHSLALLDPKQMWLANK